MKFAAALMLMLPLIASGRVPLAKTEEEGDIWVVLVAGSDGWYNYRHQSDICHAYQLLSANGIPDDHIVVMMVDDIANNRQNPYPGKIINHPTGDDVYAGVPKDYTGRQVTVENFFKVLRGDSKGLEGVGSGKVINSGPNDRIFINMDDHGSPGLFCFPYENMMANDFANLVMELKENNKFKEMMVYMESCYSGSMFQDLFPEDSGFYALSAANPHESSYAAYCSGPLNTCLGDLFSVSWMEDVESKDPNSELLKENFEITRDLTYYSDVMQWGQTSVENEVVAAFMGGKNSNTSPAKKYSVEERKASAIPSQDVPLVSLQNRLKAAKTLEEKAHLESEITALENRRSLVKRVMEKIAMKVSGDEKLVRDLMTEKQEKITAWDCYGKAVDAFHKNCFTLGQSTFALTVVPTLLNMCQAGYSSDAIVEATKNACVFPTMHNAY
ncbi:legumain-like [Macrobrachium nipponense]|uniref:legumain-like n=1 Tax=Macrobrachium nipponense TaxID=159736 RepID=UPI0030C7B166